MQRLECKDDEILVKMSLKKLREKIMSETVASLKNSDAFEVKGSEAILKDPSNKKALQELVDKLSYLVSKGICSYGKVWNKEGYGINNVYPFNWILNNCDRFFVKEGKIL